jgi:3-oxoacyl-[acyl-carrier-protein] synthase-1
MPALAGTIPNASVTRFHLNDLGIVSPLGNDKASVLAALLAARAPAPAPAPWLDTALPALAVDAELPPVPAALAAYDCRANRLLLAALGQLEPSLSTLVERYGRDRTGIVVGTSTSGIAEGEKAVNALRATGRMPDGYHYRQQELGGAADFLARYLEIRGPAYTVATTCSSGANALASARRLLHLGVCDLVIGGGADALCRTVLEGFQALESVSRRGRCNPFSRNRDGILVGEGAALFLMSRDPGPIALLGVGASSDAHHLAAPRPDGEGALRAMENALAEAGLTPAEVDYINLHGTGTRQNDAMESAAVHRLFGGRTPCSSTKGATGHCLGAAGAIEAGLCWLILSPHNADGRLPPQVWDGAADPELDSLAFVKTGERAAKPLHYCLSNSFAFGGNNVSLVVGRCP